MEPLSSPAKRLILFDGVCNLCHRSVQFVCRHDVRYRFYFAPLQAEISQQLLQQYGLPQGYRGSVLLIQQGRCYRRSSCLVRILWGLSWPWPLLGALLWLIPRPLRDWGYDWVGRRRYRWFGCRPQSDLTAGIEPARLLR